jgi:hypothetical protein
LASIEELARAGPFGELATAEVTRDLIVRKRLRRGARGGGRAQQEGEEGGQHGLILVKFAGEQRLHLLK